MGDDTVRLWREAEDATKRLWGEQKLIQLDCLWGGDSER